MLRICCVQHQQHGHHRRAARGTFDFNWRERAATEAGAGRTASKRNNRQWMAENLEAEIAAAPFVRLVLFPSLLSASGAAGGRREIALLASARSTYGRTKLHVFEFWPFKLSLPQFACHRVNTKENGENFKP